MLQEDKYNISEQTVTPLERRVKASPSPAVVFARQYAMHKGIQKLDYRKLVAHRALQRR
jgi:hypothetical protein